MPKRTRSRTRQEGPPEIWFRILHVAPNTHDVIPEAELLEQTVEIALGPEGAFENGRVGTFKRRVTPDRVVNTAAKALRAPKPPRPTRTPQVVELLRKAQEWRRQLDAGEVPTQAEIARREAVTRARVTQVMGMLRLAREIQDHILSMPDQACRPIICERTLRPLARLEHTAQIRSFKQLTTQSRRSRS